jgi:hypothetical protein
MTATTETGGATPWHLWVVGIVGALWNGFACYDYYMTNTAGDAYMASMGMTEAQIAFMHGYPSWMMGVWAIGVWGGLLGAILLLLKRKWAFHVFVASLAAFVVSLVYTYGLNNGTEVMGGPAVYGMQAVILVGCLFFVWYSQRMTKQGVLS